jgi:hypothetical protein
MVVVLSIHLSQFLILEEEDDGRGGGRQMAAVAIYPNVYATSHWLKSATTNFWPEFSPS